MTTHSTVLPDTNVPPARKNANDDRSVVDVVQEANTELKGKFRQMIDSGRGRVTEWQGGFQDGIRAKPIQSVLIAAAVGTVVGMLIGRRSR